MLFKVNPTKQNIQTEQGALIVTGNCYVQLHTPLTDIRGFKVLIKQKGEGKKSKQKASDPFCERPVINLLGTSLHQKRHIHTHSHTHSHSLTYTHTHTLTSSDYWAAAVTPLKANQREWRETQQMHTKRTSSSSWEVTRSEARDHPGNVC